MSKHLLSLRDLEREEIVALLDRAASYDDSVDIRQRLAGIGVCTCFSSPRRARV